MYNGYYILPPLIQRWGKKRISVILPLYCMWKNVFQ